MELRGLQTFVLVAAEMNLHRAAEHLGVTQPAVTAQISAMETELGFDLFVREKQRVVSLTAAGQVYLTNAQRILKEVENSIHRVREVGRGKAGVLRIGLSEEVATARALRMISSARLAMPQIAFEFVEVHSVALTEAVRRADVDACVTLLPCDDYGMTIHPLWREDWVVAMRQDHPLADRQSLCCAELAQVPLILGRADDGSGGHGLIRRAFDRALISPMVAVQAERRSTMLALVHAGLGVTFLPAFMKNLALRNLEMVPLREDPMPFALAVREDDATAYLQIFVEQARAFHAEM